MEGAQVQVSGSVGPLRVEGRTGPGLLNSYLLAGVAVEKQVTGLVPQCPRLFTRLSPSYF